MDSLARFEKILALLDANPEGLTGRTLAELCGVPWPLMCTDLLTIHYSGQNIPIYTDRDGLRPADLIVTDEDGKPEVFQPDERWYIAHRRGSQPIHLTVEDRRNLLHVLDFQPGDGALGQSIKRKLFGLIGLPSNQLFYVKGNMEPLPVQQTLLLKLEAALLHSQKLAIRFKDKLSLVDPLGLVYYTRLRTWYLAARHDGLYKTYGISKLEEVKLTGQRYQYPEDFDLKAWFKPRWGMEYGEEFNVKIRFTDRAQTFNKVRKDVAHREATLREETGYLILEDRVVGKNELLAWLMGFGSAAEILEPAELRLEMKKRLQEALARYSGWQ